MARSGCLFATFRYFGVLRFIFLLVLVLVEGCITRTVPCKMFGILIFSGSNESLVGSKRLEGVGVEWGGENTVVTWNGFVMGLMCSPWLLY